MVFTVHRPCHPCGSGPQGLTSCLLWNYRIYSTGETIITDFRRGRCVKGQVEIEPESREDRLADGLAFLQGAAENGLLADDEQTRWGSRHDVDWYRSRDRLEIDAVGRREAHDQDLTVACRKDGAGH